MGLGLSLRVIAEMARVTAPSLLDIATQSLDRETVDARARAFATRYLGDFPRGLAAPAAKRLAGDGARP